MKSFFNPKNYWVRKNKVASEIIDHLYFSKSNNDSTWEYNSAAIITNHEIDISLFPSNIEVVRDSNDLKQTKYDFIVLTEHVNIGFLINDKFKNIVSLMHSESLVVCLVASLNSLRACANENSLNKLNSLAPYESRFGSLGIYPTSIIDIEQKLKSRDVYLACFMKRDKYCLSNFIRYSRWDNDDNRKHISASHRGKHLTQKNYNHYREHSAQTLEYVMKGLRTNVDFSECNLNEGIQETLIDFPGFNFWDFIRTSPKIESEFQNYEIKQLKDVAIEINILRPQKPNGLNEFEDKDNCIYIPLKNKKQINVITDLLDAKDRDQDLCQVVIDQEKLSAEFLKFYFNSKYGQKFLEGSFATKISSKMGATLHKGDIKNLIITVPNKEQQQKVSNVSIKLQNVIQTLEEIKSKVTQNPLSSSDEMEQLDTMVESISSASWLIAEESKTHEYKSSMKKPYPDYPEKQIIDGKETYIISGKKYFSHKQIHKLIQFTILKTIAAFLNTIGGTLVIGVKEKDNIKEVVGIEREGFGSNDKYELHLNQIIENTFGAFITSEFINTKIVKHKGHHVAIVKCDAHNGRMVDVDGKFYRRTGPQSIECSAVEVMEITHHRKSVNRE
jgi:hypothetical protein